MSADILVPKLSATMDEARVLKWLKPLGAMVKPGDVIVELETDKAALEIEATAGGSLAEILVAEGDMAPIGAVLARIISNDAAALERKSAPTESPAASAPIETTRAPAASQAPPTRHANASPLARRLAREHGIDLNAIAGSAASGRIQASDLQALIAAKGPQATLAPTQTSGAPSALRRRIAARVSESRRNLPSFWLERWVFVAAAEQRIAQARAASSASEQKTTFTDVLLQAMMAAALAHPKFLTTWSETSLRPVAPDGDAPIGLVVATADGVAIPVLAGLANSSLAAITAARHRAVAQARAGRISEAYLRPCALSLSNLSSSGIDRFEAIIDPDQSAILTAGRIHERVVPIAGGIGVIRGCSLTLSVDHRLIDGRDGAAFLADVADRIERPSQNDSA